jgi:hypothetical protein
MSVNSSGVPRARVAVGGDKGEYNCTLQSCGWHSSLPPAFIVREYLLWLDSKLTVSTQKYHNSGHVQLLCSNSIPSIPLQFVEISGDVYGEFAPNRLCENGATGQRTGAAENVYEGSWPGRNVLQNRYPKPWFTAGHSA